MREVAIHGIDENAVELQDVKADANIFCRGTLLRHGGAEILNNLVIHHRRRAILEGEGRLGALGGVALVGAGDPCPVFFEQWRR